MGNQTNVAIANKKVLGKAWYELTADQQLATVNALIQSKDEVALEEALAAIGVFDSEAISRLSSVSLVDGYGRVSIKAIEKMLPHLEGSVITYDKAAALAGYHHSNQYDGEWHPELPYYGKILQQYTGKPIEGSSNEDEATYGRIANPTVHIALNQLRKVVNAIIKKYGHPDQIHIEVVRDLKMNQKAKRELQKTQKANQERNDRHRQRLAELGHRDTYDNRLRLTVGGTSRRSDGPVLPLQRKTHWHRIAVHRRHSD